MVTTWFRSGSRAHFAIGKLFGFERSKRGEIPAGRNRRDPTLGWKTLKQPPRTALNLARGRDGMNKGAGEQEERDLFSKS